MSTAVESTPTVCSGSAPTSNLAGNEVWRSLLSHIVFQSSLDGTVSSISATKTGGNGTKYTAAANYSVLSTPLPGYYTETPLPGIYTEMVPSRPVPSITKSWSPQRSWSGTPLFGALASTSSYMLAASATLIPVSQLPVYGTTQTDIKSSLSATVRPSAKLLTSATDSTYSSVVESYTVATQMSVVIAKKSQESVSEASVSTLVTSNRDKSASYDENSSTKASAMPNGTSLPSRSNTSGISALPTCLEGKFLPISPSHNLKQTFNDSSLGAGFLGSDITNDTETVMQTGSPVYANTTSSGVYSRATTRAAIYTSTAPSASYGTPSATESSAQVPVTWPISATLGISLLVLFFV